ncbi:crossover junction endodeoxyribonuclease RuvC [Paracandidimonas soli]|uniref:Crossover junction endodeoxyribonuclease RuvC n=1 Tax=Paracandidimonas soli TaxID=1917182 RepID=A0A4R3V2P9_9BURK|nr:crossover junction endodeoxyribonuclease RuvC [Paracandidimonas soli]TCU99076.1 Holliday junction endonuclease RuvC [Paracandidimonas soli]
MRILGIDPGLRRTGFGVIDIQGATPHYVASGVIVAPTDLPLAQRLKVILDNLREVARMHEPEIAAMEKVFVNTNPTSTLLLGQARGAAMCALADAGLEVHEYTALQIKKSVVGNGHAQKEQVQKMVQYLLNLNRAPASDPADALACAICHAHFSPISQRLQAAGQLPGKTRARMRGGRILG